MLHSVGTFVVTKDMVDRDGERVLPSGAQISNFEINPIMFHNHKRWDGAVGNWKNIKVTDTEILMDGYISDATEQSKTVLGLCKDGVIKTASMGFRPKKWSDDDKDKLPGQTGVTILEYEVIEVSVTDIPANPEAAMKSFDKSSENEKIHTNFKSWNENKEGLIVKSFIVDKNFENMNILEVVNKFLGTNFGSDAKQEDVEAAFKKLSEQKGMSQESVEKTLQSYSDVFKTHVKDSVEKAIQPLADEIEALKAQIKEMKEISDNPDGEGEETLEDAAVEKSTNTIDVRKFFNQNNN
jgi:HK97 family phage prohead protease